MDFLDRFPTPDAFRSFVEMEFPNAIEPVRWTTGGMTGGSCWSDRGADQEIEPEPEPEIEGLDDILNAVLPDLRFMEYRRLSKLKIEVKTTGSDREWYGNYTDYARKSLDLDVLYQGLADIVEAR